MSQSTNGGAKRVWRMGLSATVFGAAVAMLGGCPIYSDEYTPYERGCYDCSSPGCGGCGDRDCLVDSDCSRYGNYLCVNSTCTSPIDSGTSRTCSKPSDCAPGSTCGAGRTCVVGDCNSAGCSPGYLCKLSGGVAACVPTSGSDGGAGDGGKDSGLSPDSGAITGCANDAACAGVGANAKCLSGTCVLPADQCSDGTQCRAANQQCVQGACTQSCSATTPCPIGYSCDMAKGVCTGNPAPCTSTAACTGGRTCVNDRCVDSCVGASDCGSGQLCVNGGCVIDGKPNFVCQIEGERGGDGKGCASKSICLHHSCYIECDADAGNEGCRASDRFNLCKSVTSTSGNVSVCGSSSNLGNECDATRPCSSGLICIDGFCR